MPMLEDGQQQLSPPAEITREPKQRRQMLVALALLLIALVLVLIRDRQFWFPSTTQAEPSEQTGTAAELSQPTGIGAQLTMSGRAPRTKPHAPPGTTPAAPAETTAPVITNRAALPPLEVEVVTGDQRRTIPTHNPSIKVDMQNSSAPTVPGHPPYPATDASERVRLSADTQHVVTHSVQPSYPLLAKEMKVQGSVLLQALIGKDGNIQDLHVLSGPAILSEAARQAVKQWRFKPYLQNGEAVETEARITVNFTISTY
jgi:protein TonB